MKIAVTSQNRKTVTKHAGTCRKFWIYTIVDQQITEQQLLELPKEQSFHNSETAGPLVEMIDVLLTGGMGEGLPRRLARSGITALITDETDPTTAVNRYLESQVAL
ncbi:NifB/NifX family molybdenum-iron cluster-binding protein [Amphritea sp. 1_MG-2023]|uniref:NifB/NifX family molybdenum-iron cluster-binding protein n=1 Tax=Amphritea sp. 1_MG-2023 TaxID=3062670 RepID=UPI0026E2F783|nr:NifB/NifX family molybdenum-iron cluster-binding protein [Amphritea sp. 1_MG-2023]MDO6562541.1 NifB/NifX family molybdenum-iron cluster-binding protein [Amphritea sp. 1_MG-2023]